jgi:hypothetical protein
LAQQVKEKPNRHHPEETFNRRQCSNKTLSARLRKPRKFFETSATDHPILMLGYAFPAKAPAAFRAKRN